MSRTRFTRQIQFFCRVIRQAAAEGLTPQEWLTRNPPPSRLRLPTISRRTFLAVMGVGATLVTELGAEFINSIDV